jgi:hypothetical protein
MSELPAQERYAQLLEDRLERIEELLRLLLAALGRMNARLDSVCQRGAAKCCGVVRSAAKLSSSFHSAFWH